MTQVQEFHLMKNVIPTLVLMLAKKGLKRGLDCLGEQR
jgi:hypothetical protein